MADEVPVLEPGMKVKWHVEDEWASQQTWLVVGPHPLYPDVIGLVVDGADKHDDVHWAEATDLTPVPDMATFSLDLGDGRCGSVEVAQGLVPSFDDFPLSTDAMVLRAAISRLVRDVVQGKGED